MHKKKSNCFFLSVGVLAFAISFFCMSAQAQDVQGLTREQENALEFVGNLYENIDAGLLLRSGAVYQDVHKNGDSRSDLTLASVELGVNAEINDYVSADVVYLYEDPSFEDGGGGVSLDSGFVTLSGGDQCPGHLSVGKMYVPFGALLTHFPDDPLTASPVTLTMGEIDENAVLAGYEKEFRIGENSGNLNISGYTFNGDVESGNRENSIRDFGADINFTFDKGQGVSAQLGGSYLSNLADTGGISDALRSDDKVEDRIQGCAAYLSGDLQNFFLDAEYMSALDDFESKELKTSGNGAEPRVWNMETGFNYDWGKNLEVAIKYAGSDEAGDLDIPENRYGITFNQEIFEMTVFSVGALFDEFETERFDAGTEDTRSTLFSQIEVEL